jgi:hypothetical protein
MEFQYSNRSAGEFLDGVPAGSGDFRYEPYRSFSHAMLGSDIEEHGEAEIEFGPAAKKRKARISIPEYGIIRIFELK